MRRIQDRMIVVLVLVSFLALGVAWEPAPAQAQETFRIGFSNGFSGNAWRTMMLKSLQQEAEQHPEIEELIILDGQGKISKQIGDIESLVAQQVDAMLLIPNSGTAVAPAVRKATRAGIVTVPFNLPVEGKLGRDYTAYLGTKPCKKGARLAIWLGDQLNWEGKIIGLGGIPGNSYTEAAWGCAKDVFNDHDGIEILAYRDAHWQEDRAKTITADLLSAYPDIDGVWADGGQDGAGAMKAFLAADRDLVPVTGDDYNGLLKLYDRYGDRYPRFSIGLMAEPTYESKLALQLALKILKGEEHEKRKVINPQLISSHNYEDFIMPDMPDSVFVDNDLPKSVLREIFTN